MMQAPCDGDFSVTALLDFLKSAGMEGRINPATARARRNAIEQLGGELTTAEREDLRRLDLAQFHNRFHKLEDSSIRAETLALYTERFAQAVREFIEWRRDPIGFRSQATERPRARPRSQPSSDDEAREVAERITLEATDNPANIVPVQLRVDHVVYLANLPMDLRAEEAEKLARILRAFAADQGQPS